MTYNPNIPVGPIPPATQASEIQTNFSQLQTVFSANHTALNLPNQGDHETIIMENQAADPGVTQNLAVLYNKNAASFSGSQPQLFAQIPKFLPTKQDPTNAKNLGMQLTYNTVNTSGPQYQSFLPGGYILYFGSTTNISVPITLSPQPTAILTTIAIPNTLTTGNVPFDVSVTRQTNVSITINSTLGRTPYSFTYFVIGQA